MWSFRGLYGAFKWSKPGHSDVAFKAACVCMPLFLETSAAPQKALKALCFTRAVSGLVCMACVACGGFWGACMVACGAGSAGMAGGRVKK